MVDTNMKTAREYKEVLDTARDYASEGIVDDAVKYYKKALEYKTDAATYIEYVNVYVDNGQEKKALRVAEEMVKEVKNSAPAYECLLDRYIALKENAHFDKRYILMGLRLKCRKSNTRMPRIIKYMQRLKHFLADSLRLNPENFMGSLMKRGTGF